MDSPSGKYRRRSNASTSGVSPGGSSATAISRPTCRITWPFTGITVSASRRSSPSTWLPVAGARSIGARA